MSEIRLFAGTFAPRSWMFCQGQLLSIAEYSALFALVGTTYGGDGQVTFGIPDLRGRAAVGTGNGPALTPRDLGEIGGSPTTQLTAGNLPAHVHSMAATVAIPGRSGAGTSASPVGNIPAASATHENYAAPGDADGAMAGITFAGNTGPAGNGAAFDSLQPSLALNFIICVEGIFPSRN